MRLVPFLILTITATVAVAPGALAGDRYGPPPARPSVLPEPTLAPGAPTPVSYAGPTLAWPGKVAVAAPLTPQAPAAPQRLAEGLYRGGPAAAPPPPAPTAPLPDSLYAPTQPAQPPAASLPPPPGPTRLATAAPYAASTPRAYSVIREYGGTPDPIAPPVGAGSLAFRPEASLVAPLDEPEPKPKDRSAQVGDPDWGAADDPGLTQGTP